MQTEIIEGNKLIGIFDGWYQKDMPINGDLNWFHHKYSTKITQNVSIPSKPEYFNCFLSWDWLIPVWYKFRDLKMEGPLLRHYHKQVCASFGNGILTSDITGAFNDAVMAIKWYNSIK